MEASSIIHNRDYVIIIDKSGSMNTADMNKQTRWKAAAESTFAFASKVLELTKEVDAKSSVDLYLFSDTIKHEKIHDASRIKTIFSNNYPEGSTDLAGVLQQALDKFMQGKRNGRYSGLKQGETIIVVTDGIPDDEEAVKRLIIDTSNSLDNEDMLGITFVQVGHDKTATNFLKMLDDDLKTKENETTSIGWLTSWFTALQSQAAKFDIVDTIKIDDVDEIGLTQVLINAIKD